MFQDLAQDLADNLTYISLNPSLIIGGVVCKQADPDLLAQDQNKGHPAILRVKEAFEEERRRALNAFAKQRVAQQ